MITYRDILTNSPIYYHKKIWTRVRRIYLLILGVKEFTASYGYS